MKRKENPEIKIKIGKNIKNIRKMKKYTQQDFADLVGIHVNTLRSIEKGTSSLGLTVLTDICNKAEISPNLLFAGIVLDAEKTSFTKKDRSMLENTFNSKDRENLNKAISKIDFIFNHTSRKFSS